ncbi:MAG: ABC transporter ATP-binding protein [Eubacteriales bacterium]|nr:ABC transporter ATP-binding protein [Eubacteriales bacterium]
MENRTILSVQNISISFGGLKAVNNFSIKIKEKELYGLIGPNGAGKTTIFNLLTGVYKPDSGKILLENTKLVGKSCIEINKLGIARTFQNIRLFSNMSVLDNVKTALHESYKYSTFTGIFRLPKYFDYEKKMTNEAYELLKMFSLEKDASLKASNLPYGKQRKLEIARALSTKPTLLLLDEPAAGMNSNETKELMDTISFVRDKFNMTILLIEHDMKLVSGICEKLTVLNFGEVLKEGDTNEVLNDEEVIKAYLGD